MSLKLCAACGCSMGKVRANNEDNFYFCGSFLPADNRALPTVLTAETSAEGELCTAVFDGMGGEQFGELASYAAAHEMKERLVAGAWHDSDARASLHHLTLALNAAVLDKAQEMLTRHMGSTLAGLFFRRGTAWAFNLGDSRIYLGRGGVLRQLSVDHVDARPHLSGKGKGSLTQYLGIDEEEFVVEPAISAVELHEGDCFLVCSDGLTDMLSDDEILASLLGARSAETAVEKLIAQALERGGRDNVTVIVCMIR
ncbi:MAG: serine/threonine-protein phosphatase [Oscillospiraceae bacterium]|nr:serine/threonine-protein phosphatase [Oscillospiraceae bacterium]